MNKADNLRNPKSCLNRAEADEPLFVLRAKDPVAAQTVRHWATMSDGNHEAEKIAQALKAADEMDAWRARNVPGVTDVAAAPWVPVLSRCNVRSCENAKEEGRNFCALHHD